MPLESLLTLVEKLRERITANNRELRKSEWLTRYALIDPLLRELGWDTEDPALVIPEYNVGDGSAADYALLSEGKPVKPVMMVEAKSLGTPLQAALEQGLRYCLIKRTRYLSITDGGRWEIYYDTDKTGDSGKKRLVQFDLKNGPATEACLKALTLWELRESGHIATGQTPIVGPTHNPPASPEPPTPQPTPPSLEWQPLSELNQRPNSSPPVAIQFSDNSAVSITSWTSILVEVAKWLEKKKLLTENHCPISVPRKSKKTKLYVVHTEAVHSHGRPFRNFTQVGSFYIVNSSSRAVACAIQIIEHVGQDPAQFKVRFSPTKD